MYADMWSNASDWSFQPNSGFSCVDSSNSFIAPEEEPSVSTHSYANLWEIQLELGEILGMTSDNLLQPCCPSTPSWQARSSTFGSTTGYLTDDQCEPPVWSSEMGRTEPPESLLQSIKSPGIMDGSKRTGARYDMEYGGDEDMNYDDEEDEQIVRDISVIHPIYGRMDSPLEVQGKLRHDRKDSGVSVSDQHQSVDGSIAIEEQELKPTKADSSSPTYRSQGRRREHGAVYTSLRRIAFKFLRSW
ncbi:hypothetical protein B0O80DRAFT_199899 [Mortierella sp. GBAus27b]|nr:hypothetical protein B0O80DRAFT_199899 [Mortierella sp. GBAus27b]